MTAERAPDIGETPEAQAAHWMTLKRSGEMSALDARALELWLQEPAHRAALAALEDVWEEAGDIREDPAILAMREQSLREFNQPARMRFAAGTLAACAALVAGGYVAVKAGALTGFGLNKPQEQVLRTGVGQTSTVTLPDGSIVTLDTDSVIRARETFNRRLVTLEKGRAFFSVAKDRSRPFIVTAGGKTVTAVGTAFEVRIEPKKFEVTLVEGRVTVEAKKGQSWEGQQAAHMRAGWRLVALDDKRWNVSQVDVNKETSWLAGRLTFYNDPLGDAASEVNRYSEKKVIVDPKIAEAPIVGVFEIGDVETFVRGVKLAGIARVVRDDEKEVELAAK